MINDSVREFISNIKSDEVLKAEAIKAFKEGKVADFAAAHGYKVTEDELRAFANNAEGEIPVEDLESYSAACGSNYVTPRNINKMILC